jgi:hypothetical protein
MNLDIIVIRIDPASRTVVKMKKRFGRDATSEVRRILRGKAKAPLGWRTLLDIEEKRLKSTVPDMKNPGGKIEIDAGPTPLIAAGLLDADEGLPTWRLRGTDDHAGIGLLFGRGNGGGMVDVPVSVEWIEKRILWGAEAAEADPL